MEPTSYVIVRLPKLEDCTGSEAKHLAQQFRILRLLVLKTDPDAFASSCEVELRKGHEQTLERLNNLQAVHFVATQDALTSNDTFADFFAAKWAGLIVLIGPVAGKISAQSDPLHQAKSMPVFGRYHLNGVFIVVEVRRAGVGCRLIAAALAKGRTDSETRGDQFSCTIMVDSENIAAEQLYKSFGFRVTGTETYIQQARSSSSRGAERVASAREIHR